MGPVADLVDIADITSRTGLPPSTLRYYERLGLIASADRHGLRRQYHPEVIRTLAVIVLCQKAGFSLDETSRLLATDGDSSWKELASAKRDALASQLHDLTILLESFDHALTCPSPNAFECEHFLHALDDALPARR